MLLAFLAAEGHADTVSSVMSLLIELTIYRKLEWFRMLCREYSDVEIGQGNSVYGSIL